MEEQENTSNREEGELSDDGELEDQNDFPKPGGSGSEKQESRQTGRGHLQSNNTTSSQRVVEKYKRLGGHHPSGRVPHGGFWAPPRYHDAIPPLMPDIANYLPSDRVGSWDLPRDRRRGKHGTNYNKFSRSHSKSVRSPPPEDANGNDYDELLIRYRMVQRELEALKKQEEEENKILEADDAAKHEDGTTKESQENKKEETSEPALEKSDADAVIAERPTDTDGKEDVVKSTAANATEGTAAVSEAIESDDKAAKTESAAKKDEDDDDDTELLELRLLALASTVAKNANKTANNSVKSGQGKSTTKPGQSKSGSSNRPVENRSGSKSKNNSPGARPRGRTRSGEAERNSSTGKSRNNRKQHHSGDANRRGGPAKPLAKRNAPSRPAAARRSPVRRGSAEAKRSPRYSSREPSKRDRDRERVSDRRNSSKPSDRDEYYRKQMEEQERKRHEVMQILTIDDHEEQVRRFMKMVSHNSDNTYIGRGRTHSPLTRDVTDWLLKASEGKMPGRNMQDNYEEVEMDIDSAENSPAIHTTDSMSDFASIFNYNMDPKIPGLDLINDTHPLPYDLPAEPPPLPSEPEFTELAEEPPPPPPPLPPADGEEDEEEMALRAQLLQSMVQKRNAVPSGPIENKDRDSQTSSPVPTKQKPKRRPKKIQAHQIPQHGPVVIQLGQDSSDDSDSEKADVNENKADNQSGMLGGLDMFLKQARMEVETPKENKHSKPTKAKAVPKTPEAVTKLPEEKMQEYRKLKAAMHKRVANKGESIMEENRIMTDGDGTFEDPLQPLVLNADVISEASDKEEEIKIQRAALDKEKTNYMRIQSQIVKKRTILLAAQKRMQMLREQLEAAEKIANANRIMMEKLVKQAEIVKGRVEQKARSLSELQGGGAISSPNTQARPEKQMDITKKRKVMQSAENVEQSNKKQRTTNIKEKPKKLTKQQLAKEKERLQILEREYAQKIEELKKAHEKQVKKAKSTNSNTTEKQLPKVKRKSLSNMPQPDTANMDKIELNYVESENVSDIVVQSKRRRSLLDLNPSMKPNIEMDKEDILKDGIFSEMGKNDNTASNVEKESSGKKFKFAMPLGQQLDNLQRVQKEKLEKFRPKDVAIYTRQYDLGTAFYPEVKEVANLKADNPRERNNGAIGPDKSFYTSPLLNLKSYKFSPYFRTRANVYISSPAYANKLHPKRPVCRFDLMGSCNDEHCAWQHGCDYSLSNQEILEDLISYHPAVAGVTDTTPKEKYTEMIAEYVTRFIKQHQDKMSHEEMCILLVNMLNKSMKHVPPHTSILQPRIWKLQPKDQQKTLKDGTKNTSKKQSTKANAEPNPIQSDFDSIISDQDIRYFMLDSAELKIQDMESAVLDNPENTDMWIKLAYKKLADPQCDSKDRLDHALNVLSRGLEANKHDSTLWQHYLSLFGKRSNGKEDVSVMCQQALQLAPCYNIWWMYLSSATAVTTKLDICKQILEYLSSHGKTDNPELLSHQVLEVLMYITSLNVQSGKYIQGLKYLQGVLTKSTQESDRDDSSIPCLTQYLTQQDRCLAFLTSIHLSAFQSMPCSMFDPANNNPGRIVNKDPFLLPWKHKTLKGKEAKAKNHLAKHFTDALKMCADNSVSSETNLENCMPLYRNLILFEQIRGKFDAAKAVCRKLLTSNPKLTELWLVLADLEKKSGKSEPAQNVLKEALEKCQGPTAAVVYHAAATHELTKKCPDSALEYLESCAVSLFDVDVSDSKRCDPNLLYCKLLSQSLPLQYSCPNYIEGVHEEDVKKHQLYLWLNYCLLLSLQGDESAAVEAYETALYSVTSIKDVQTVWMSYLNHHYQNVIASPNPSDLKSLTSLTERCLVTMPVQFPLPHNPTEHWSNYTFHTQVVDFYMTCLPATERNEACQKFLRMMPANTELAIKAIEYVYLDDPQSGLSLCFTGLQEQPASVRLFKLALNIIEKEDTPRKVRKVFKMAIKVLPYTVSLWKDFILFEITKGSQNDAEISSLIEECNKYDVNIAPFLTTILKLS